MQMAVLGGPELVIKSSPWWWDGKEDGGRKEVKVEPAEGNVTN